MDQFRMARGILPACAGAGGQGWIRHTSILPLINNIKDYIFKGLAMIPQSRGPENIQNNFFIDAPK
jgi:hypothetical protein